MKYTKLFEPANIGPLQLKNRLVMSPMHTGLSEDSDSRFTHRYIEYYKERARGGVGLIITCHVKADKKIDPYPFGYRFPCFDSPSELKFFADLTENVHRFGSKIAIELSPGTGRLADVILENKWPAAPSEVPILSMPHLKTRALTKKEISGLVEAYGEAAGLAKQAGFDVIYVHFLAYIGDQFLSSLWNQRVDEYGGSLQNRMRFLLECIESVRQHVGNDFPLIVGLAMDHGVPGGREVDETIEIARKLQEIGINALHLRRGCYDAMNLLIPTAYMPDAIGIPNAEKVKKAVDIPIIVDGNLGNPDLCEKLLEEKKLDFVGLGRPLIADPQWPNKVKTGKIDDIRPCIRCNQCINRVFLGQYSACAVNPEVGREYETPILPATKVKRVLVIGGGIAGMMVAKLAADKGHNVTLLEKGAKLGGHLWEAIALPSKKETAAYLKWLNKEVQGSAVQVKTNTVATKEFVQQFKPDAVVVCTGSVPWVPDVPGINAPHVKIATDLLRGDISDKELGNSVVVVGGGLVGCEAALYLADKGKSVTLVEMLPEIAADVIYMTRPSLLAELEAKRINCLTGLKLKEVTGTGIVAEDSSAATRRLPADTVIMATGLKPENKLYQELYRDLNGIVDELYEIGDCVQPRKFIDAVQEAYLVAKKL